MHAARNIALCTKDCLCLFICPTGATDTETGQIDFARCIDGCRLCVDACPSHAIHVVFDRYPAKSAKDGQVVDSLLRLLASKTAQESLAKFPAQKDAAGAKLARAIALSNRILAEDCVREANYMLPQAAQTKELLTGELERGAKDFPTDAVKTLLERL